MNQYALKRWINMLRNNQYALKELTAGAKGDEISDDVFFKNMQSNNDTYVNADNILIDFSSSLCEVLQKLFRIEMPF